VRKNLPARHASVNETLLLHFANPTPSGLGLGTYVRFEMEGDRRSVPGRRSITRSRYQLNG